jgi:hypothetical protein
MYTLKRSATDIRRADGPAGTAFCSFRKGRAGVVRAGEWSVLEMYEP